MPQDLPRGFLPLESRKRLAYLSLSVVLFFSLLLVQFYKIQIVEKEKWSRKADAQHQLVLIDPCQRGSFYSNTEIKSGHLENPVALVFDVPRFHLYADTTALLEGQKKDVTGFLTGTFLEKKEHLFTQLAAKSRGRKLLTWLTQEEKKKIESWWFPYAKQHKLARNVLFFVQDFQRSYPYGKMLGQLLHTVREDRDPKTGMPIPTGGLELFLHRSLQGKEGKRLLLRSPKNALEVGKILAPSERGLDVFLTINHYLQAVAEEEMEKAVKAAGAKSGWAIMMDPFTGEILAWAQYPWFDPSHYRDFFNDPRLQEESKCKGITDAYEPGSTFKPLTIFICLKANEECKKRGLPPIFSPEEKIATGNGIFPGRSSPIRDTKRHSYLNMYMAIQKSSNIYMARMVQRVVDTLGVAWYRNCLAEVFGFGQKTGIELPSESAGLLPLPGKVLSNGTLEWSKATPYSIAFGHNILVNSLQMVRAYALLANGGHAVYPTLLKKMQKLGDKGKTEVVWQQHVRKSKESALQPEFLDELIKGMMYVTKPGGGAGKGDIPGYTEAGKTGTSEKIVNGRYSKTKHISSFIGWAPVKQPRFVLMIVIDEPEAKWIPGVGKIQYGGNCAAPSFREIGRKALEYLGVAPDDPFGYPEGDPRSDRTKAHWQEEARKLGELYKQWNP